MKKVNKYNLIYSCILLIISLIAYWLIEKNDVTKIYGGLSILLFISGLILWIIKYRKINTPILFFLAISYICWFGEIIIKTLHLDYTGSLMIDQIDTRLLNRTIFYSIIGYGMLFLGAMLITKKEKIKNRFESIEDKHLRKAAIIVGTIMVIIGMPQFIFNLLNKVQTSMTDSYMAIYESSNSTPIQNIMNNLEMFFIPGLILLMISCKKNKIVVNTCLAVGIVNLVLSFLSGARGQAIGLIITLFWTYSTQIREVKAKQLIIIILVGVFIFKGFNIVSIFRVKEEKDLTTFIESLEQSNSNSTTVSVMKEMGANIFSLYNMIDLVPEYKDYSYGYTYFASVMAIIPSILMGGYSFSDEANLAGWLMETLNLTYGPGCTIIAESYYNFGMFGTFAMLIIGMIYAQILQNNAKEESNKSLYGAVIGIGMYISILTFRGTMLLIFRKYFYVILIPMIVIYILKNTLKKKDSMRR